MTVHSQHLPAIGFKPFGGIVGDSQIGAAVDGDAIVVKQHDQTRQPHVAGHRRSLMADAFHQASVTGNDICVVVDKVAAELRRQMFLGHCHANRIRNALAKRAGRGLDPGGVACFRMTGGDRAQLPEVAKLVQRHVGITGQMQQGVDQHGPMSCRQDKPVAIRPVRRGGVKFQMIGEQRGRSICHAHRHAGVT